MPDDVDKAFLGRQPHQMFCKLYRFGNLLHFHIQGDEMSARENFIEFYHRENFQGIHSLMMFLVGRNT